MKFNTPVDYTENWYINGKRNAWISYKCCRQSRGVTILEKNEIKGHV